MTKSGVSQTNNATLECCDISLNHCECLIQWEHRHQQQLWTLRECQDHHDKMLICNENLIYFAEHWTTRLSCNCWMRVSGLLSPHWETKQHKTCLHLRGEFQPPVLVQRGDVDFGEATKGKFALFCWFTLGLPQQKGTHLVRTVELCTTLKCACKQQNLTLEKTWPNCKTTTPCLFSHRSVSNCSVPTGR